MIATDPLHAVALLDKAFNERDVDTLLDFYDDQAIVVAEPGRTLRGRAALRAFFERAMQAGTSARQLRTRVLESDGVALFLSRWTIEHIGADGGTSTREFVATSVFRQQPDGGWKALIDNAFGPLVLEA